MDAAQSHVLIAAPHALARTSLRHLIESEPDLVVVGEAGNCADVLEQVRTRRPDVLLLDSELPGGSLHGLLREVRVSGLPVRTLVLSAGSNREAIVSAVRSGAQGVVSKDASAESLFGALRAVAADRMWLSHEAMSDVLDTRRASNGHAESVASRVRASLTRRQTEALAEIAAGESNRQIARKLGVTEQSVKNLLSQVYDKVGVSSRLELAVYALHHDLTGLPK